jgi:hypothetical protein
VKIRADDSMTETSVIRIYRGLALPALGDLPADHTTVMRSTIIHEPSTRAS